MLHESLREFSGVDLRHLRSDDPRHAEWEATRPERFERFCRNWFGLTDSPYRCMQPMIRAKQIAYGDRKDERNPFAWDRVELNLPGSKDYDPSKGWVVKLTREGDLACEVFIYIDDGRVNAPTKIKCWAAAQRFASVCNSLGIQSAGRKRTPPSQQAGPWAGNVVHTVPYLAGTVTNERWAKTRKIVGDLVTAFKEGSNKLGKAVEDARPMLDLSLLQSSRGFLNYVSRTYRWMPCYLKGLHLTIDIWRQYKDKKTGYSLKGKELHKAEAMGWHKYVLQQMAINDEDDVWAEELESSKNGDDPPAEVRAAERLWSDLHALEVLTRVECPPLQRLRANKIVTVIYIIGDASGCGLGSIYVQGVKGIWQSATASEDWSNETSNFREADNLTTRLEEMAEEENLEGVEIFLITDNMVFEGAFYKGHSSSEKLTGIILRLRILERDRSLVLHVIHISGKRMKLSGVDGLSRGDTFEGIMAGKDPLQYIPLNESAHERSAGSVERWVRSWWSGGGGNLILGKPLKLLEPNDWFSLHEIEEARLWMPPPAAMETVISLFHEDRLTRPDIPHVFCVPRLMTHLWRKTLQKDADLVFQIQPGNDPIWTHSQFEPLVVLLVLPFAHVDRHHGITGRGWYEELNSPSSTMIPSKRAFELPRTEESSNLMTWIGNCNCCGKTLINAAGIFCANFCARRQNWPQCRNAWCGQCYRQSITDRFPKQEEEVDLEESGEERKELRSQARFENGRNGDHLMGIPFECELCHFRNITGRDPNWASDKDAYTLTCIRRANLDAMWSREPSTVRGNLQRLTQDYRECSVVFPFAPPMPEMSNPSLEDRVGMKSALYILHVSRRPGKNAAHLQPDTVRKTVTWMSNLEEAGSSYTSYHMSGGNTSKQFLSTKVVGGKWFQRFMLGMRLRTGVIRIQNEALTSKIVLKIDVIAEEEWRAGGDVERRLVEGTMAAMLLEYGGALRGEELSMARVEGAVELLEDAEKSEYGSHSMWALQGRFKAEKDERWHCIPIAYETRSRLPFRKWFRRMNQRVLMKEFRRQGWYFTDPQGIRVSYGYFDPTFKRWVAAVQERFPGVVMDGIDSDNYSLWRSPRRGAITEATNAGVESKDIELIGRWRKKELARGTEPGLPMRQVYTDVRLVVKAKLRFSKAL